MFVLAKVLIVTIEDVKLPQFKGRDVVIVLLGSQNVAMQIASEGNGDLLPNKLANMLPVSMIGGVNRKLFGSLQIISCQLANQAWVTQSPYAVLKWRHHRLARALSRGRYAAATGDKSRAR